MINVENLSFRYPHSSTTTLKSLNFCIEAGEIFGFLGPSGAGKSTTQKLLYKILSGFEGTINIDGEDISSSGPEYFEKVGVGFELPNHYLKLTASENLRLFISYYDLKKDPDVSALLKIVGLEDHHDQRVEEFSKGMMMRLNFVRAIMHDPQILFFDEPTAGLDPINSKKIKEHILDLKAAGKTIFITTHDMATADELCDRVSFIVDGEIRVTDEPGALRNKYGKQTVRVEMVDESVREFPIGELGKNPEFLSFIKKGDVKRINTLEASLEEVFIKVTGTSLIQ